MISILHKMSVTTFRNVMIIAFCFGFVSFSTIGMDADGAPKDDQVPVQLTALDLDEQQGNLHPESSKVLDINNVRPHFPAEIIQHIKTVANIYLARAKYWPADEPMSPAYAKAIGSSFTWFCLYYPTMVVEVEPSIHRLIQEKKLTVQDLWLDNLPRAKVKDEGDHVVINRAILQFNKRLFSDFRGNTLLFGVGHNSNLRELGEPYYRLGEVPTPSDLGTLGYSLDADTYYAVDLDSELDPDAIGNAGIDYNIMIFPSDRFERVIFNYIGYEGILTEVNLMQQYFRILKAGGTLEFKGRHHPNSTRTFQKDRVLIEPVLNACGFQIQEITVKLDPDFVLHCDQEEDNREYLLVQALKP